MRVPTSSPPITKDLNATCGCLHKPQSLYTWVGSPPGFISPDPPEFYFPWVRLSTLTTSENVDQWASRRPFTHIVVLHGSKNLALVSFPGLIWVKHRQWSALTHKPIVSLRTRIKHHLGSPYPNTKHAQRIYKLGISWPDKHQHASSSLGPRAFLTYPPQTALYNNPTGIDILSLLDFPSRPPLPSPLGIRRSLTVSQ